MSGTRDGDLNAAIRTALGKVIDPELRRPITELGMVKSIDTGPDGSVHVEIYLTIAGCPKKSEITERVAGGRRRARHFGGAGQLGRDERRAAHRAA